MFDNVTINTPQETSELNSLGDCPFEPDFVTTSCFGVGFNAPTVDIKVKVKKKYEGLFKEIKVALEVLDKIRPYLENDGGSVKFNRYENGIPSG